MKFKCAMLDGEALCNIVQFRIAQSSAHTDTHQCNAVQSNAVQSNAVQSSAVQCRAVQCSTVQWPDSPSITRLSLVFSGEQSQSQ